MNLFSTAVAFSSLVLIGCGLYLIYPPAAPLGVGLLLWIDLSFTKGKKP